MGTGSAGRRSVEGASPRFFRRLGGLEKWVQAALADCAPMVPVPSFSDCGIERVGRVGTGSAGRRCVDGAGPRFFRRLGELEKWVQAALANCASMVPVPSFSDFGFGGRRREERGTS